MSANIKPFFSHDLKRSDYLHVVRCWPRPKQSRYRSN